jgi:hypothetical protein
MRTSDTRSQVEQTDRHTEDPVPWNNTVWKTMFWPRVFPTISGGKVGKMLFFPIENTKN